MHNKALPTFCSFALHEEDDEEGEEEEEKEKDVGEEEEEEEEEESAKYDCTSKPLLAASEGGICRNEESLFVTPFGRSALYLNAEICVSKPKNTRRVQSTTVIFAEVEWMYFSLSTPVVLNF